jgi:hypothetical protein
MKDEMSVPQGFGFGVWLALGQNYSERPSGAPGVLSINRARQSDHIP